MGNWLAMYGARLWQVDDRRQVPSVVELGAGLGLCSLVSPDFDCTVTAASQNHNENAVMSLSASVSTSSLTLSNFPTFS